MYDALTRRWQRGGREVGWGSGGKEGREGFLVEIVDKYLVDSNSRLIWLSMPQGVARGGYFGKETAIRL